MITFVNCNIVNMYVNKSAYIIVLWLLLLSVNIYAQDSTYVSKFNDNFSISISGYNKFTNLQQEFDNADDISYKPNNPVGIGFSLSWKGTSLSFGYAFDFMRDKDKGRTTSTDFQYHYYGRKVILDFFFQKYKGFYREIENEKKSDDDDITIHPDISVIQYGLFGQYVFNGKRFSSSAAFNQNEIQRKSTGSFLLGGGIYYNRLKTDYSLIFDDKSQRLTNFQMGINAGYSYSWVIKKRFYASVSASVGLSLGSEGVDRFLKDKLEAYPVLFSRVGLGYNANNWSLGVSFIINRVYVGQTADAKISLESGIMKLTFSKRLETIPIFSKLLANRTSLLNF